VIIVKNETIPVIKKKQEKHTDFNLMSLIVGIAIISIIVGVSFAVKKIVDYGNTHRIVSQRVIDLQVRMPFRIEEIKEPEPIKELVIVGTPYEELTSTEQKIIQVWGDYKQAMLAIAIFKCESGLDPEAVSETGDLGVAQINWKTWKNPVKEKFGYTAIDMFDVDKNLEVAKWIWDRGNRIEGDEIGSWEAWTAYASGAFVGCLE